MNPKVNGEEAGQYMQVKTTEKMIINQIQCFLGSGIKVLTDLIREALLDTYIKIETKLRFKNRGILFLLNMFEKDVAKMIIFHY